MAMVRLPNRYINPARPLLSKKSVEPEKPHQALLQNESRHSTPTPRKSTKNIAIMKVASIFTFLTMATSAAVALPRGDDDTFSGLDLDKANFDTTPLSDLQLAEDEVVADAVCYNGACFLGGLLLCNSVCRDTCGCDRGACNFLTCVCGGVRAPHYYPPIYGSVSILIYVSKSVKNATHSRLLGVTIYDALGLVSKMTVGRDNLLYYYYGKLFLWGGISWRSHRRL